MARRFLKPQHLGVIAGLAATVMAIPGTAIWAQDAGPKTTGVTQDSQPMADTSAPGPTGMPRNIIPMEELAPADKPADTPPENSAAMPGEVHMDELPPPDKAADTPPSAPLLRSGGAVTVQVGELGTLEGPLAGILDASNGGLGSNEWQGSDRATMVTMLQSVPAATPSATQHMLIRKLLLSAAAPPPGRAMGSFNQLRLTRLLDGGYIDDAANLALRIDRKSVV